MFYDYELGRASYESPSGRIEGELTLKRQYRIEKGKLLLMFDSNIAVRDNILQDILAESAGNRMKTIVTTIQREQNRAIRYEGKRVVAVQGPAGSGKTSIALHRAAYLLYRYRNNLKADNICLLTPNGAFSDYISAVLPELGEENLQSVTLAGLARKILGGLYRKYESYAEMTEWLLTGKGTVGLGSRWESMCFKSSKRFVAVLERFVQDFESKIMQFEDIRIGNVVFASKEELEELFHVSYRYMPLAKRLSRMEIVVTTRIREYERRRRQEVMKEFIDGEEYLDNTEIKALSRIRVTRELEKVMQNTKNMLSVNISRLYRMLFEYSAVWDSCGEVLSDDIRKVTISALDQGVLFYEDQAPILYMMALLGMIEPDRRIRHVIIDEAQDYSAVAYKLFSLLYFHCNITLLGDINQNINTATGIGSLKSAGELIDPESFEYIELDKSYRSTLEIMEFASRIVPSGIKPFGRHGKAPEIVTAGTVKELCSLMTEYIRGVKGENYRSIAVVSRTLEGCRQIFEYLGADLPAHLIKDGDEEIPRGIAVMPSYLTKGLEFDAVIAAVLSKDEYTMAEDHLFYTVCTRALHRLGIFALEGAGVLDRFKKE